MIVNIEYEIYFFELNLFHQLVIQSNWNTFWLDLQHLLKESIG